MSGVVFHHIAEGVMARNMKTSVNDAQDENSLIIPDVKNGNIAAASKVLTELGIKTNSHWGGSYTNSNPIWGSAERKADHVALTKNKNGDDIMPDITGMGAKDAVYLLETYGIKVKLNGRGKVRHQSIPVGTKIENNAECTVTLE